MELRLTSRELEATLNFLRELYVLRDLDGFIRHIITALPRLVPSDHTSFNEVNPRAGRNRPLSAPEIPPDLLRVFEHYMDEHPLIRHYKRTADGRALKISDFLSVEEFHRLSLYKEFFKQLHVNHQMAFVLPSPRPLVVGIALNRDQCDFTEQERLLVNLLRDHIVQAYRNADAVTRSQRDLELIKQGIETSTLGLVLLGTDGRPSVITTRARHWLRTYFGSPARSQHGLPEVLQRWIRHDESTFASVRGVPSPRQPLMVRKDQGSLVIRLVRAPDRILLLLEERRAREPRSFESLGLSRREAEVLCWVTEGKTNPEIGLILGTRSKTVSKHLERVYQKLGVENRTAAATLALTAPSSTSLLP